jgi:hypothetical protein
MSESSEVLQYAGEYSIEVLELYTTSGLVLDLRDQVADINIYEDLMNNALTGDISFLDTNNLVTNGPIIGQEKLRLKIITPQAGTTNRSNSIDYTEIPLHVYKVGTKTTVNENTVAFTLGFTSSEMVRNNLVRVNQSFKGEPAEDMIREIIRNPMLLNSTKEYFFEKTANNYKYVAANQHPFDFINAVAKRCLSVNYNYSPSYLFYETTKGYYFRSIDNMMDVKNPKIVYRELVPNKLDEKTGMINVMENMTNIIDYDLISSTNTLFNSRTGMYASKLTMIDLHNKNVTTHRFNYIDEFNNQLHVDHYSRYNLQQNPILSGMYDGWGYRLTDYSDAAVFCQTTEKTGIEEFDNAATEGVYNYNAVDRWLMARRSRISQLKSALTLRLEVPGNTTLEVGDLIGVVLRTKNAGDGATDPYLTGRYLIKTLRHEFQMKQGGQPKHFTHMEVVRDTVSTPYPDYGNVFPEDGPSYDLPVRLGSEDPSDIVF